MAGQAMVGSKKPGDKPTPWEDQIENVPTPLRRQRV
jgi:hypothetical protein